MVRVSSSRINMEDARIDRALLKDYGEIKTSPTISSGTLTLDLSTGNVFEVSLNANITTLTISNPSPTGNACSFTLIFIADGTARTVTWPSSTRWQNGTTPTLTSTSSRKDFFTFYTSDAGTNWYGFVGGQNLFSQGGFMDTLTSEGLTTDLKLCLDAGDALSAPSSTTKWLDRSGNGYDFFRGISTSSESSDPTFTGTVGGQSSGEYWSFDGGDIFRYDSTNETWINNIHKNNAKFTLVGWFYINVDGVVKRLAGTSVGATSAIGFSWFTDSSNQLEITINNGNGVSAAFNVDTSGTTLGSTGWKFLALRIDEAAGSGTLQINGTQVSISPTYSSPSASDATYTMEIGANGNATAPIAANTRVGAFFAWEGTNGALTTTQLTALYNATRTRYGI